MSDYDWDAINRGLAECLENSLTEAPSVWMKVSPVGVWSVADDLTWTPREFHSNALANAALIDAMAQPEINCIRNLSTIVLNQWEDRIEVSFRDRSQNMVRGWGQARCDTWSKSAKELEATTLAAADALGVPCPIRA